MTIQEAVKQLKEMRDSQFMPVVFKLYLNKVIETIANEFAPTKDDIYWGYTATIERPLADKEIVFRLRAIQKHIGGSYAIDRAIEVIEEVQELFERHGHVAGGNKKDVTDTNVGNKGGLIEKQAAIDAVERNACNTQRAIEAIETLPSAQPETEKYEYHYDHTDCIWYRPEARNRCPVTCAQYRDGWNDAMNYIFRDGKGYMPYRRDKQYGE